MTTTDIIESATAAAFNAYEEAYRPVAKHTKTWGESEDEMDRMVWHAAVKAALVKALPGIVERLHEGMFMSEAAGWRQALKTEADRLAAELREGTP